MDRKPAGSLIGLHALLLFLHDLYTGGLEHDSTALTNGKSFGD